MNGSFRSESEDSLANLVHELRQPLSTLEYSARYLQMLLGGAQEAVQQQLRIIQDQIDFAAHLVDGAAAHIPRLQPRRATSSEGLSFTKSETVAVR